MTINFVFNEIIAQRYQIISVLGQGNHATTYQAIDLKTNTSVALKILPWQAIQQWKTWELLEREARVLAKLDHDSIPKYIDFCGDKQQGQEIFVIIQELAPGKSLVDWVKEGWRTSEAEVRDIAQQVLEIFQYLHNLDPPVIHQDIKPQNLLRTQEGKISLVDFGSVQNTYYSTMMGGSTVVGTYGYMSKSLPQTDLYGLGATLLYLLTHCEPTVFSHNSLKLDLEDKVKVSPELLWWLEKILDPEIDNRFKSAEEALLALNKPKLGKVRSLFIRKTRRGLAVGLMAISLIGVGVTIVGKVYGELSKLSPRFCGSKQIVKEYILDGGNPNSQVRIGRETKPLIVCHVDEDDEEIVKLLIDKGADVNAQDNYGNTPLFYTTGRDETEIAKLLIDNGANVNAQNHDGNTLLLNITRYGNNVEIAKLLIDNGANVNAQDHDGNTPLLHITRYRNNMNEVAKLLINHGADVNLQDKDGKTPLLYATEENKTEIAKLLIDQGADVNLQDKNGNTPLLYATQGYITEIAKLLIEKGADVNARDKNGNTSLLYATYRNNRISREIAKLLIDKGADVNVQDKNGNTPLLYATNGINREIAKLLIDKGADVNLQDKDGNTPLLHATNKKNTEIAKLLIDNGADVNAENKHSNTSLLYATLEDNKEMVKLLIDNGANVDAQNSDGNTPLLYATYKNNKEIAKLLIDQGADVHAQNNDGKTPCDTDFLKNTQYCN